MTKEEVKELLNKIDTVLGEEITRNQDDNETLPYYENLYGEFKEFEVALMQGEIIK